MDAFTTHTGIGVPLRRSNVDTDQIIPAVYLKRVTRTGFEDGLFVSWRAGPVVRPQHPAVRPRLGAGRRPRLRHRLVARARRLGADGLRVPRRDLLAVRRHLPWQLGQGGLLAAQVEQPDVELLWKLLENQPGHRADRRPAGEDGQAADLTVPFDIDDYTRWRLLEGLDDIGLTLRHADEHRRVRGRPPVPPADDDRLNTPTLNGPGGQQLLALQRVPSGGRCAIPLPSAHMNKSQLVDALADRLGDRKTAATAVDALLQIVVDTVRSGDTVSLAGFGVFESRARAARTGRNPRTGESVAVPATTVPAFRPGTGFRNAVAGDDAADVAEPAPAPAVEDAAPAQAPAPPRRRRRAASATNGSGDGASLNGAVDLSAVPTTTLLAEPPAAADEKPAAKKPTAKKPAAAKPAEKKAAAKKAELKVDAKPAAKSSTKSDTKKGKKGKKGK